MTPTPKHIEEAQRLAFGLLSHAAFQQNFGHPHCHDTGCKVCEAGKTIICECLNLPTLLAAQEKLVRMTDLVRYQRAELHQAGLINDDEYAQLCAIQDSPSRLESYDKLRADLAHMREERDDAFQRGYESAEALRKQLIEAQARSSKLLVVVDAARTSRQMHQETRSLELLDAALSDLETDNTK